MQSRRLMPVFTFVAGLLLASSAILIAGPLDPPAGPITSTGKTLTEVEPRIPINAANTPGDADSLFKITQPGSYYLTSNITGVAGKHGIEITASGVTLDLNGFDLVGIPGMGAFDGVSVTVDGLRGIAVLNGSVRNWGDGGIDLGFVSRGCRVEGVRASGNAGTGITSSIASTVTNCTSAFNGQRGIFSSNGSTITNCSVESNLGNGIQVNQGCTVSACGAYFNTLDGIFAGTGCRVADSSSYQNQGDGIQVGEGSTVAGCSALSNGAHGINTGVLCTLSYCSTGFNSQDGIFAGADTTIDGCTARSNGDSGIEGFGDLNIRGSSSSDNARDGINTSGGILFACVTNNNGSNGIRTTGSAAIKNCSSSSNTRHGISVLGGCLISGNICTINGLGEPEGSGIRNTGLRCHIVGNHCTFNVRGIDVGGSGNVVTGNTCSDNDTDWVIVAGNAIGPILDRRNPGGAAVNGFSAPTTLNTTDPHANFSY